MKSGKNKRVAQFLKISAVVLVSLVVGVLAISFSDLTGPIAEPPGSFEEAIGPVLDKRFHYEESQAASDTATTSATTLAESQSTRDLVAESDLTLDERIIERLRPIKDISALPLDRQQTAREWCAAADKITSGLLALSPQIRNMRYMEAFEKLWGLHQQDRDLVEKYYPLISQGDENARAAFWKTNLKPRNRHWLTLMNEFAIAINVEHEEWLKAGDLCMPAYMYMENGWEYYKEHGWERRKSYYKKAGMTGYYNLFLRSVEWRVISPFLVE